MNLVGLILADSDPPGGISYQDWLDLVTRHPNLAHMEDVIGINPFTKQPIPYKRPYAAWVLLENQRVGQMVWDGGGVHVFGTQEELHEIAENSARVRGRVFRTWGNSPCPPQIL